MKIIAFKVDVEGLFFLILFFVSYLLYKYYISHTLFEKIQYCSGFNSGFDIDTIAYSSRDYDKQYKLKNEDIDAAIEILHEFQEYMTSLYFKKDLSIKRIFLNIPDKTYCMFYFFYYLSDHHCDWKFNNKKIYEIYSENDYVPEYSLTQFGIVYYKLYYITCFFCEKDPYLSKHNLFHFNFDVIKQCIDKGSVKPMI